MILDQDLFHHLRSMALFGVSLHEVEVEVRIQMSWVGLTGSKLHGSTGHDFAPAPSSVRFSRVRSHGRRDLLLLLENTLPPGAPQVDHLQQLRWIYAGPAGVFSPKQVSAFWVALCAGYTEVTGKSMPHPVRAEERQPAGLFGPPQTLTINLGRLIAFSKLTQEIFDLAIDEQPTGELMFQRTRLQSLYEKFPCERAEFDAVCLSRETDPVARAMLGIDAYYSYCGRDQLLREQPNQ